MKVLYISLIIMVMTLTSKSQIPNSLYGNCLVIGHRGAPGFGGENTIFGFEKALDLGADGFELDIIPTKDGKLIIGHDFELNRLLGEEQLRDKFADRMHSNGEWIVTDFTQEELSTLKVTYPAPGSERYDYRTLSDEYKMPTLEEALALLLRKRKDLNRDDLVIYIEIKTKAKYGHTVTPEEIAIQIADDLEAKDLLSDQHVWIQSFDDQMMDVIVQNGKFEKLPKCQLGIDSMKEILGFRNKRKAKKYLDKEIVDRNLQMLHIWKVAARFFIDKREIPLVQFAHDRSIPFHLYTFRDPQFLEDYKRFNSLGVSGFQSTEEELAYFIGLGVDAVMTDYVTSALEVRNRMYGGKE